MKWQYKQASGTTGIPLHLQGKFIQALECEKSSVNKLYTKIAGDFIIKRVRL
ncbi:MAG: BLUF domain-containing protein [Cytophagales bacterium]|nr:BLUF domain-containing protein [Cytophagales bacterium]MCA6368084.1 BLUF domain-containing protein [Cytophagales bacterium]MCA6375691.1 BLUF domain-containing protein [Cytophagales bacterium]MCA6384084.1 BLUF domain-containing protein [Cytophagales bacterium]